LAAQVPRLDAHPRRLHAASPGIVVAGAVLAMARSIDTAVVAAVGLSVIAVLGVEPLAGRLWYARNESGFAT
jgi:hypothetical protein